MKQDPYNELRDDVSSLKQDLEVFKTEIRSDLKSNDYKLGAIEKKLDLFIENQTATEKEQNKDINEIKNSVSVHSNIIGWGGVVITFVSVATSWIASYIARGGSKLN